MFHRPIAYGIQLSVLLVALCACSAFGQSASKAEPPEYYVRAKSLMDQLSGDLKSQTQRYAAKKYDAAAQRALKGYIADIATYRANMERAFVQYERRDIRLNRLHNACSAALQSAFTQMLRAATDEVHQQTKALSKSYAKATHELKQQRQKELAELNPEKKDYEKEKARIEVMYGGLGRKLVVQWTQKYEALTARFMKKRASLAGEVWKLVDFHERRHQNLVDPRTSHAKNFRALVYRLFEHDLKARPQRVRIAILGTRANDDSVVDLELFNSSKAGNHMRFDPSVVQADTINMKAALAKVPVEKLVQYDKGLPKLVAVGKELEQMCRLLEASMLTYAELDTRFNRLLREAGESAVTAERLLKAIDAIERFKAESFRFEREAELYFVLNGQLQQAKAEVERANDSIAKRLEELAKAEEARQAQLDDVYFRNPLSPQQVSKRAGGAKNLTKELAALETRIQRTQVEIDRQSDPAAKQAIRNGTLKTLLEKKKILNQFRDNVLTADGNKIKQFEAKVADAKKQKQDAQAEVNGLQTKLNKIDTTAIAVAWKDLQDAHRFMSITIGGIANLSTAIDDVQVPKLPASFDQVTKRGLFPQRKAVDEAVAPIRQTAERTRRTQFRLYAETSRLDRQMADMADRIMSLKIGALALADKESVGPFAAVSPDFRKSLAQARSGYEKIRGALNAITKEKELTAAQQKVLPVVSNHLSNGALSKLRTQLTTIGKVANTVGSAGAGVYDVVKVWEGFQDKKTQLKAIAHALDALSGVAGKAPVIGPVAGQFLVFYAKGTAAAADATLAIQAKIVANNMKTLLDSRPPDKSLYTASVVSPYVPREAVEETVKSLQLRRLLFLISSAPTQDVQRRPIKS